MSRCQWWWQSDWYCLSAAGHELSPAHTAAACSWLQCSKYLEAHSGVQSHEACGETCGIDCVVGHHVLGDEVANRIRYALPAMLCVQKGSLRFEWFYNRRLHAARTCRGIGTSTGWLSTSSSFHCSMLTAMVSLQMEPHVRCARCIFKYLETELACHFVPLFLVFLHKLAIFCRESKKTPNLADSDLKRKQLAFVHVAYCFFSIIITVVAGSRDVITSGLPGEKKMAETYKLDCLSSPFLGNPLVERY